MIWIFLSIPILGILATLIIPMIRGPIEINKCINNGGSFNYEICECDFEEIHPYKENALCK